MLSSIDIRGSYGCITYITNTLVSAKLCGIQIEDRFHSEASLYYLLVSSETSAEQESLIEIDVNFQAIPSSDDVPDVEIQCRFNILNIQWNPRTIFLLCGIVQGYLESLDSHSRTFTIKEQSDKPGH